ncbi:MAG: diacylglycerol kinase family protein, partial [Actinomycetota bacterium]
GDGSVNCGAEVALKHDLPYAVVPGGTFNHLAGALGITSIEEATRAITEGRTAAMDVGSIDGKPFFNTASIGVYVELVEARERLESTIGKWPAVIVALVTVLRQGTPLRVEIDGVPRTIWMIFIGNCRYRPEGFAPSWRERLDDGTLDIRIVNGSEPWSRTRLVLAVMTGQLGRSRVYEAKTVKQIEIKSLEGPLRLARDGETFDGSDSFVVAKYNGRLLIYVPGNAH